jgi:FkbM family methyltransferase
MGVGAEHHDGAVPRQGTRTSEAGGGQGAVSRDASPSAPEFVAQFGEDRILWDLLGPKNDGFFLDIGAYDGVLGSNTYFFEQVGWSGICIEPNPWKYVECTNARPRSRVVHAALSRRHHVGVRPFTIVTEPTGSEALSFLTTSPLHLRRCQIESQRMVQVPVPVLSADIVLGDHAGPIDFVSLDVEGAELDVLAGFDLNRFRPRAFVIEDNTFGRDWRTEDYMARYGYRRTHATGCNFIYMLG